MTDRFKLEEAVHAAWATKEDIELLFRNFYDGPKEMTADEVANALLGIAAIHNIRMQELWNTFTQLFELDQYRKEREGWEFK